MPERRPRLRRSIVRVALAVILLPAGVVGVRWVGGNQGALVPDQVYRSGQLTGGGLTRAIERHGVKTVLNLRGSNPDEPWYQDEREATLAAGATLVDVAMASDLWLTREQARVLVDVIETCERPMLVHCQWGAERTGLVSAIIELLRPGGSLKSAYGVFSPYYLYLPISDGLVMRAHVDRYAGWLSAQKIEHAPDVFRRWLTSVYAPGSPSREEWPYDPYPLAVITRPGDPRSPVDGPSSRVISALEREDEAPGEPESRRR